MLYSIYAFYCGFENGGGGGGGGGGGVFMYLTYLSEVCAVQCTYVAVQRAELCTRDNRRITGPLTLILKLHVDIFDT